MPDSRIPWKWAGASLGSRNLPANVRRALRFHLAFALLDAAAAGILSNAGIMALRGLGAADWQLGLRLAFSSVGMFATLPLGHWMARRRKTPFVVVPGIAFAVCSTFAALTTDPSFFLVLLGIGAIFEVALRPAITAVVRQVYPATCRGAVTGMIRKWASLVFLISILSSATVLSHWSEQATLVIPLQMLFAGALSLASFLAFRLIPVPQPTEQTVEPTERQGRQPNRCYRAQAETRDRWSLNPVKNLTILGVSATERSTAVFRETWDILRSDGRFRRYLLSSFLFGFSGLLYAPFVAAFLVRDLSLDYLPSSIFLHVIPSVAAFLLTGWIGQRIDQANPWTAWKWIRLGWGLDPLLLAMAAVTGTIVPGTLMALPIVGRLSRGASMGGSWILWWQLGINHFAKPGADTTRYMGIFTFLNGVMRLSAPLLGAWLLVCTSRECLLLIGGCGVLISALHAGWEARRERRFDHLATMADFEATHPSASSDD